MSFPSNKTAASQKLNPFHCWRLAERGHSPQQTTLPSSCFPSSKPQAVWALRAEERAALSALDTSPLQGCGAASYVSVGFFPSTYQTMPRYLVQLDQGQVVSIWVCQETKGSPPTNSTCAMWGRIRKGEAVLQK